MSTTAIAAIAVGYLCAIAAQCVLWFAAYKAGLLVTAMLLAIAAALLAGIGVYMMLKGASPKSDAQKSADLMSTVSRMKWRGVPA